MTTQLPIVNCTRLHKLLSHPSSARGIGGRLRPRLLPRSKLEKYHPKMGIGTHSTRGNYSKYGVCKLEFLLHETRLEINYTMK